MAAASVVLVQLERPTHKHTQTQYLLIPNSSRLSTYAGAETLKKLGTETKGGFIKKGKVK